MLTRPKNETDRELVYRRLQFQKRNQLFVRSHIVTLSIPGVRRHPDGSPFWNRQAQAESGFLEIFSDDLGGFLF